MQTLHRVIIVRDFEGHDTVKPYELTQFDTVQEALSGLGENQVLYMINRAIEERSRADMRHQIFQEAKGRK